MTRWVFILFFSTAFTLLFSLAYLKQSNVIVPYFLRYDYLAENHQSKINVHIQSKFKPSEYLIDVISKDYNSIWAHLNYLYSTNDVYPIKEWVTERFYKTLVEDYQGVIDQEIQRKDLSHNIYIKSWSNDGLVCHLIDSVAVIEYKYPNGKVSINKAQIAFTLLFQGDNWRVDAINFIQENTINE